MAINGICSCGNDPVTSAVEGIQWAVKGCETCGEKVIFEAPKSNKKKAGQK